MLEYGSYTRAFHISAAVLQVYKTQQKGNIQAGCICLTQLRQQLLMSAGNGSGLLLQGQFTLQLSQEEDKVVPE